MAISRGGAAIGKDRFRSRRLSFAGVGEVEALQPFYPD